VTHRDFPFGVELKALTELRLLGGAVCPTLKFLKFTPNLKSLYLIQETGETFSHFRALENVNELK